MIISPLDGRYTAIVAPLAQYCSETALLRYRLYVEVEYLIALRQLKSADQTKLRRLYQTINARTIEQIQQIEHTTKHDVKAIEYYLKAKLKSFGLTQHMEWVHFGLTSEDINNLAYSLMLRDSLTQAYLPTLSALIGQLKKLSRTHAGLAMLSLTHGQPATPTTVGKELNVFVWRLQRQYARLKQIKQLGKFGGATGNWAALTVAQPKTNWLQLSKRFVTKLGLEFNPLTTQIESHDRLVETYQAVSLVNSIVKDLAQDMWLYIARGLFTQKNVAGEIGSSAMPHKINPIWFENSEGNAGVANALLHHLSEKLPISRMQRDLTDSTVLRNQGVALAHSYLALENVHKALQRVAPNTQAIAQELDQHWEVLAEPIQTVMRSLGKAAPYEQLKKLTRGQQLNQATLHHFIDQLDLPAAQKRQLKQLTPANYIGLSKQLARL